MSASVLLDTSFLITLVDKTRSHHLTAKQYYQLMLQESIPMYFSAIVAAEYAIKQPIEDLPLKNFRPIPFNVPHGKESARLWNALDGRDANDTRHVVRDDVKLMAQANHEKIAFILTDDENTLYKYCDRLRGTGHIQSRAIKLSEGFDLSAFNENRQRELNLSPK